MKELTVIVPVKNEAGNVGEIVKRIHESLTSKAVDYTALFVVDKSTDGTVRELKALSKNYPIRIHLKKGKAGKGYSILEGLDLSKSEYVAFVDGDLQYPPEIIPELLLVARTKGVAVANRKTFKAPLFRKLGSKVNRFVFGKLLLGFDCDVQAGLKVFKSEIGRYIDRSLVGPWTIDMPLLFAARELGYEIGNVDITFEDRKNGASKVGFFKTGFSIFLCALRLKLKRKGRIYPILANKGSTVGAGLVFKRKRYITHSELPKEISAVFTFSFLQKTGLLVLLVLASAGFYLNPRLAAISFVGVLTAVYFLDVLFNLFIILKSLHFPPEISIGEDELKGLKDSELPVYSILCPLYKEAGVLSQYLKAIDELDWPKDKLDVLLLLEEDDTSTISAVQETPLPGYIRVLTVPHSHPKTKPKACNYGLAHAKGKYVVIYDAEDIPEATQLKKAYLAFKRCRKNVVCLQAKLNYYNPHHNILTRLFTAEYSLWFDVILPGLQSVGTTIPLGGTSNHFVTETLKELHGWDSFNVTEDCDLGARLFTHGYKTAIIDSTTLEEANSKPINWIRQRSRWIKGYMQTYLVHMRNPLKLIRRQGWHFFLFQLVIGGKIAFMLINPFLWVATVSYFTLYRVVGPTIESLYPPVIFYMAVFSLVVGNFVCLYNYMIGCAKRGHWPVIKYVFLVPFYWLLASFAAFVAFYQLLFRPHYWEKTHHGFHIRSGEEKAMVARRAPVWVRVALPRISFDRLYSVFGFRGLRLAPPKIFSVGITSGGILVLAGGVASFLNFLYNAYLGRVLTLEEFGLVGLIGNFLFIVGIPLDALSRSVVHRSAYLFGKYKSAATVFWSYVRSRAFVAGLALSALWVVLTPPLRNLFRSETAVPFVLFAPVWLIATLMTVDKGFLIGNHRFKLLALLSVLEASIKIVGAWAFVKVGRAELVYAAIPISLLVPFLFSYLFAKSVRFDEVTASRKEQEEFPTRFFAVSTLLNISSVAYLSFDVIVAKIFLSPSDAGLYALISLVGKMIYLFGALFSQFILPVVSREEGAGLNSKKSFYMLLGLSTFVSLLMYGGVGVFGNVTAPILLGDKILPAVALLPLYGFGMLCFTVASTVASYHQIKGRNIFPVAIFIMAIGQVAGISIYHESVYMVVRVMVLIGVISLCVVSTLHVFGDFLDVISWNLYDLAGLFARIEQKKPARGENVRVLIFNWRDTKHVWAGGAEVYLHEIAKKLVEAGNSVTIFCGNDGRCRRYEKIDGVSVVRRGGFYTVYIWAFLYYILKFRRKFDVVVDSENGIPFFTPLYVHEPVVGLVHHVHQDVFRRNLAGPLAELACFLEGKLMPVLYRNVKMVTVSESSKADLMKLGFGKKSEIEIVNPGIEPKKFAPSEKTEHPSILYLGRLKDYKSIDVLIRAMEDVVKVREDARLTVAGFGEAREKLERLVSELNLGKYVSFAGKVSEEEKVKLMARSWVFVYPSSMEGWGIAAIEANACGTPVIASDVPGLRDSVRNPHTGYLVRYGDVQSFASKINRIIGDKNLRKILEYDSVKWAKSFTWEASADKLLNLMRRDVIVTNKAYENF